MKNFDAELQHCVHNALHDKWVDYDDDYSVIHSRSETFKGENPLNKISFKDITGAEPKNVKHGTRKLILSIPGNRPDTIVFNVQQFLLESNGKWTRILNMGNFTVPKKN